MTAAAVLGGCAGSPNPGGLDEQQIRRLLEVLILMNPDAPERQKLMPLLEAILAGLPGADSAGRAPSVTSSTTVPPPSTTPSTSPPTSAPPTTAAPEPTKPEPTGDPSAMSFRSQRTTAQIAGCEIFPPDHYMNAVGIDRMPATPDSATTLALLGDAPLQFPSSSVWMGSRGGMPINIVDSSKTGTKTVQITGGSSRSYRGKYPVPSSPKVEGHPGEAWDKHMLMVDTADCTAYETIQYAETFGGRFAWSGARYRLDNTDIPAKTTNVADTPMIGQYIMRHEVVDGEIPHVLSWCTNVSSPETVWPAQYTDGLTPGGVPMGTWIRLKPTVKAASFTGDARPVVEALASRGAVLTDTCGQPFRIRAENSDEWDNKVMDQLNQLTAADFDVIDASAFAVSPKSFQIR